MTIANTKDRYGWIAIALHWAAVVAVIAMLYFGWRAGWAGDAGDRALRRTFMSTHIALGAFTAVVVLLRLVWSVSQPRPEVIGEAGLLKLLARATHVFLLLGLLALVVSGPLAVWSGGRAINVFDWFSVPSPLPGENHSLHELAETVHAVGRWILYIALPLHLLGVAKHLLIDRDQTLARMLWSRPAGPG